MKLGVALFLPRRPTTGVVPTTAWPWFSLERKFWCLVANHGRGLHHGLAVVVSGSLVSCLNITPRPWPSPRAGRGWLWKYHHGRGLYHTLAVVVSVYKMLSFCFLNRGRGYHHGLAVVDSVCVIVVHMPRVLIPYARVRIKDDLAL